MGASGSELKRVRQSKKSNLRNRHYKSMMKTSIKKVLQSNKETSEEFKKKLKTHCASQGIPMSQMVVDVLTASLGLYDI